MTEDTEAAIRAQLDYYDGRAPEYDDAYARAGRHDRGADVNARWRADMADVGAAFDRLDLSGDVLELAAGTGAWTEHLVARAESLTVFDASPAMLDANRARLGSAAARVDYRIADLFAWQPDREWDACVFGFWLCKIPDDRLDAFLGTVAQALRTGGVVCCIDKAADAEPPSELEARSLADGREFTIVDHPRPPARIVAAFAAAGLDVTVETFGDRFCLASGWRR